MKISDILILIEYLFIQNKEQRRIIFGRLRATGLNFNAPKCSFWFKDIPYLEYGITREDRKPEPNKIQGIMDLGKPSTTTEA